MIQPFLGMELVGYMLSCDIKIKLKSLFFESFNIPMHCNRVINLKQVGHLCIKHASYFSCEHLCRCYRAISPREAIFLFIRVDILMTNISADSTHVEDISAFYSF